MNRTTFEFPIITIHEKINTDPSYEFFINLPLKNTYKLAEFLGQSYPSKAYNDAPYKVVGVNGKGVPISWCPVGDQESKLSRISQLYNIEIVKLYLNSLGFVEEKHKVKQEQLDILLQSLKISYINWLPLKGVVPLADLISDVQEVPHTGKFNVYDAGFKDIKTGYPTKLLIKIIEVAGCIYEVSPEHIMLQVADCGLSSTLGYKYQSILGSRSLCQVSI